MCIRDSLKAQTIVKHQIGFDIRPGYVAPTNSFLEGDNKMSTYLYCEAGFVEKAQSLPNSWVNVVCPNTDDFEFLTKTLNVPE